MAGSSIPRETCAPTHFVELVDHEGRLVLLPAALVDVWLSQQRTTVTLTITLPINPEAHWLTVSEAAREHLADLPPAASAQERATQFKTARAIISRACSRGDIAHVGKGHNRRLEPNSFAAWRLQRREQLLEEDGA